MGLNVEALSCQEQAGEHSKKGGVTWCWFCHLIICEMHTIYLENPGGIVQKPRLPYCASCAAKVYAGELEVGLVRQRIIQE